MSVTGKYDRDRAARTLAKADFDASLARVRGDLAARGVAGRVVDGAVEETAGVAFEAIDVARANKTVIAGTVAALAAWLLRRPLIAGAKALIDRVRDR